MKVPTCGCLVGAVDNNEMCKHTVTSIVCLDIQTRANFKCGTTVRPMDVSIQHNFCPQCGAPYVEEGDKTPHYSAKELEEQLQRAHDELKIVYELADAMYKEIPNGDNIFEAAEAYDEWIHAGETVPEEVE